MSDAQQFFSTPEIAEICHVTVGTVRDWINQGRLKAQKGSNGRLYVEREEFLAYARKRWGSEA